MSSVAGVNVINNFGPVPPGLAGVWYSINRCWVTAAISLGFSLRFKGGQNIPRTGAALLVANHQSFLDPLAIGIATPRQLRYLARKTLFNHAQFGAYLRSVGCVAVDQEGFAREGLKITLDLLKDGQVVLVFPEGERTLTGKMLPLKPGIHLLMKRSGVPIIPVGIAGAYDAYPRTAALPKLSPAFLPASNATVAVCVGKPLDPHHLADWPREQVLQELFDKIYEQHQCAEQLRRKPYRWQPA